MFDTESSLPRRKQNLLTLTEAPTSLADSSAELRRPLGAPRIDVLLRWCAVGVFVLGALLSLYANWVSPTRPSGPSLGYYGYYDQSCYLAMAKVFAVGHIPANSLEFTYGIGFPLLGAPLVALGVADPFLPIDVVLFGVTVALTFLLGARIVADRSPAVRLTVGAASAALLALGSPALSLSTVPWNTNLVVPLGLFVLLTVTSPGPIKARVALAVGLALGWIFATRYLDALFAGLPVLAALVVRSRADARRLVGLAGAGALSVLLLVLGSQKYAFGGWFITPYRFHLAPGTTVNDQSTGQYKLSWIPRHLIGTFVTARLGTERVPAAPILQQFPALALTPVSIGFLRWLPLGHRPIWITAVGSSVLGSLFYLSFVAGSADNLKYGNTRYWSAFYPLWCVLTVWAVLQVGGRLLNGKPGAARP